MSIETIVTRDTIKAKAAAKMGFDQPSALDLVSRRDYSSDEAYLDAAVKAEMERSSPEYQAIRRKLAAEYQQRHEEAERKVQAEKFKEIRSNVQLWDSDTRAIDAEAAEMAHRDLAAGRIGASEMGKTIEKYAKELTEKRKDNKAQNQLMSEIIRGAMRG